MTSITMSKSEFGKVGENVGVCFTLSNLYEIWIGFLPAAEKGKSLVVSIIISSFVCYIILPFFILRAVSDGNNKLIFNGHFSVFLLCLCFPYWMFDLGEKHRRPKSHSCSETEWCWQNWHQEAKITGMNSWVILWEFLLLCLNEVIVALSQLLPYSPLIMGISLFKEIESFLVVSHFLTFYQIPKISHISLLLYPLCSVCEVFSFDLAW